MNFIRWRIGQRLSVSFLGLLVLMVVMAVLSIVALRTLLQDSARVAAIQSQADMARMWAQNTRLNVNRVMALAQSRNDPKVKAYFDPLIKETTEQINAVQKELEEGLAASEMQQQLAKVSELRSQYIEVRKRYFEALKSVGQPTEAEVADAVDPAAAAMDMLNTQLLPAASAYMAAQEALVEMLNKSATEATVLAEADVQHTSFVLMGLTTLALAVGLGVAYVVTRSITQPLRQALDVAGEVAQGDLRRTIKSDRQDEVGDLLRMLAAMQASLREVIGQIE
jgi:HAMP domain-containing protein